MEPALDPTQLDELRAVSGGDEAWFAEILQLYLETARGDVATLVEAAATPENSEDTAVSIDKAAHRVKGQSSYLGARELTDVCRRIMELCKQDPPELDTARALVPKVSSEFKRVEIEIQQMLSSPV